MISNMNKEYHIAEGVTAFSTTRKGGVSQGNYSEFNINDFCGDCAEHVAENRRKLADELGAQYQHIDSLPVVSGWPEFAGVQPQ